MFELKLLDSLGNVIQLGDMLWVTHASNPKLQFYTRLWYDHENKRLQPYQGFHYDRIVKVDKAPNDAHHVPARDVTPEFWIVKKLWSTPNLDEKQLWKWWVDGIGVSGIARGQKPLLSNENLPVFYGSRYRDYCPGTEYWYAVPKSNCP